MADQLDVAVVGAGPFGLSVAAHLADRRVRAFGAAHADVAHADAPGHAAALGLGGDVAVGTRRPRLDQPCGRSASGEPRTEPIPLQMFLRYADWFRDTFVPDSDPSDVAPSGRAAGRLPDHDRRRGTRSDAARVVVAVGVTPFPLRTAPVRRGDGRDHVGFAIERQDYSHTTAAG